MAPCAPLNPEPMKFLAPRVVRTVFFALTGLAAGLPSMLHGQTLSATPLAAFGAQCANSGNYGPNSFLLSGAGLNAVNLNVGPLTGYTFSTVIAGPYSASLSIAHSPGGFSRIIYVRFTPVAVQNYNGNIPVSGGGAPSISVPASGSGIDPVPTVTSGLASGITADGASCAGQVTDGPCSATTAYGIEYSTVNGFADGTGTQVPGSNLLAGNFSCTLTGLQACTPYYFKAYAVNGGGTGYGAQQGFTTSGIGDPVATAGTAIGTTGFDANWNAVAGATGYYLDVSTSADFGTPAGTVVGWDFNDQDKVADSGAPANATQQISSTATGFEGYANGVSGKALYKKGWDNGSGTKYWMVGFSTAGFSTLTLSSVQRSWNYGPRDFKVQYRIGTGGSWTDVAGSTVTVANDYVTGVLNALPLPAACNDQAEVYLRWIMTSNTRFDGLGPVVSGGSSVIEDIVLSAAATPLYVPGYEDLDVGNVTTFTVTGLTPQTTYYYRVRAHGTACTSANSNVIPVTTSVVSIYYSRANGTVLDPIWSNTPSGVAGPAVFTAASGMVVQAGNTVTSTAVADLGDFTVDAGGTLVINGFTDFRVHGNAAVNGTLTCSDNSTLSMLGTGGVVLANTVAVAAYNITANVPGGLTATGTWNIRGSLQLQSGNFNASGASITLVSDQNGTGRLSRVAAASGASYTGNMKVQRYIPAGHTNWRMLGSPVAGRTVNDWQDDFFTAGYPGSAYPNFYDPPGSGIFWPSIRKYREINPYPSVDSGLVGVSSNLQQLVVGKGFMVWCGDNLTTTAAFTIDVTGAPNIGAKTLPMSFTSSGTLSEDGWNMVSNPYPSAIAFDSITRGADVLAQYSIFDPVSGTQQSYSGGIGQGGVNGIIQSSQGFWLKANGPAVTTVVNENDKVGNLTGGVFGGYQQAQRPILRLVVSSNLNTFKDEATVVFDQGAPGADAWDAYKNPFRTAGAPQLSIQGSGGEKLAMEFYGPYATAITIPVLLKVDVTGNYSLTAGMTGLDGLSCFSVEDLATGTVTALQDGMTYAFTAEAGPVAEVRFLLHATAPLSFNAFGTTCADMADGRAEVVTPEATSLTWTTAAGDVLATSENSPGETFAVEGLAPGAYSLHTAPMGACGALSHSFTIIAPVPIGAELLMANPASCPGNEDGSLTVAGFGGTGELAYHWDDGTMGTTVHGAAGARTLTITDGNGCSFTGTWMQESEPGPEARFSVAADGLVPGVPALFSNHSHGAETHSWTFGDGHASTETSPAHIYGAAGSYDVSLTTTAGACSDTRTETVQVGALAVAVEQDAAGLAVQAVGDIIVITHGFGQAPVDVEVHDLTGRQVISRRQLVETERITLPAEKLGTGIWFVRVSSGSVDRTFRVPMVR